VPRHDLLLPSPPRIFSPPPAMVRVVLKESLQVCVYVGGGAASDGGDGGIVPVRPNVMDSKAF
jgi:hypothetical protein